MVPGCGELGPRLELQLQLFLPELWVLFPLSSCLFFVLCLHPDAPCLLPPPPGEAEPRHGPRHPAAPGTHDQRLFQLFHFRVLGAHDPFLEFLYQGRPRPSLGPFKVTALGFAPHTPWLQNQG